MFKVSREWIKEVGHEINGAWNREQLAMIGVGWPAPKGWVSLAEGLEISEEQKHRIENSRLLSNLTARETHERHVRKMAERYYTWPDGNGSWTGSEIKPDWWDQFFQ